MKTHPKRGVNIYLTSPLGKLPDVSSRNTSTLLSSEWVYRFGDEKSTPYGTTSGLGQCGPYEVTIDGRDVQESFYGANEYIFIC